jgi:hypothetical protein
LHGVVFDIFGASRAARRDGTTRKGRRLFQAVAQIVGFGLERSKILDLSMGID